MSIEYAYKYMIRVSVNLLEDKSRQRKSEKQLKMSSSKTFPSICILTNSRCTQDQREKTQLRTE